MSFGSDTPPPAPDYSQLAKDQGVYNTRATEQQTVANRPTIVTPWGTQSWEQTPGEWTTNQEAYDRDLAAWNERLTNFQNVFGSDRTVEQVQADAGGKRTAALFDQYNPGARPDLNNEVYKYQKPSEWQQNTTLDPRLQSALESQFDIQNRKSQLAGSLTERLYDAYSEPFSFKDIPALPGDMQQITQDTYNKMRSLSDPYTEREGAALESSLANKGINIGNEQWTSAMQQRGDDLNRADLQRQLTALREGRDQASSQINLRNAAMGSQMLERSIPLNEMNAILSGQQVSMPNFGSFTPASAAKPVDVYGAAKDESDYMAELFNYGQTKDAQNTQAGAGLASTLALAAAFAMSDGRLKRIIKRIGQTDRGTPIYLYLMGGKLQVGVVAQESPKEAVRERQDGWLEVNYMMV